LDNANKLFNLIKHDGAIFSLVVLKPIGIQEKNSNQILYFDEDYTFEQTIENSNYVINDQPTSHFFRKIEVATCGWSTCCMGMQRCKKVGKNEISQSIYDFKFAKRCANVVFYDEVNKYFAIFSFLNETFLKCKVYNNVPHTLGKMRKFY
jgi:hypothetical protein